VGGRPLELTREESQVVEQAQGGDARAFGVLVQRYQEAAFHLAYVIVGEAHEAEDVAQDAFVKAYFGLPRFRVDAPFRPWLMQIVANEARNRRRAAGRREHMKLRVAADQRIVASGAAPSPEAIALADEQRQLLLAEVDALRDEDRVAIAGRYFMDLSEAELADLLGCARGTVKSRLSRGLARLRTRLEHRKAIATLIAALLLLGLGLLAWPESRNAIAERLGLRGVSITHLDDVPASTTAPTQLTLGLGPPVSIARAREQLGAPLLIPDRLGQPDEIYAGSGQAWLVYAPRQTLPSVPQASGVGLLLTEFRASFDPALVLGKGVPSGTRIEEVRVNGDRALWIEGAPHLFFRESNGNVRDVPARLAANTLLWEENGLTLRIEAALPRDAALAIATTMRGTD
jgi:RNA polymerase sigma factor (sigma-70 family)